MKNNQKKNRIFSSGQNKVLCIGGLDPSGGAGVTADILTMSKFGVSAVSLVTALTAQNTRGVYGVCSVDPSFFSFQLETLLGDTGISCIKIGMLYDEKIFDVLIGFLCKLDVFTIWDPVMDSSSGYSLMEEKLRLRIDDVFTHIDLITPNVLEAEFLSGESITSKESMLLAAKSIAKKGCKSVLIKGGHMRGEVFDLLYNSGEVSVVEKERQEISRGVHGTGCALSSAIAAHYASGFSLEDSVKKSSLWMAGMIAGRRGNGCEAFSLLPLV